MTLKKTFLISVIMLQLFSQAHSMHQRKTDDNNQVPSAPIMNRQARWYDNPQRFNHDGCQPLNALICCLGCTALVVSYAKDNGLIDKLYESFNEKQS